MEAGGSVLKSISIVKPREIVSFMTQSTYLPWELVINFLISVKEYDVKSF